MKVYHLSYPIQPQSMPASSIAIGNFDGIHKGHQMVIGEAKRLADRLGLASGVMTFHPHPKEVLGQVTTSSYLTPLPDKLSILEKMDLDLAFIVQFTPELSKLSPEQFIEHFIACLNVKQVVTGFDFRFGQQGKGNVETLLRWSKEKGDFLFHYISKIELKDEKISSTRVRRLLGQGDVYQVMQLLGRPYRITGQVVTGERRGRTIGFPTANLSLCHPYVIPKRGVYAIYAQVGGRQIPGVVNIGKKPTFPPSGQEISIEAHLFNFAGDLYGKMISLDFIRYLRDEQRFSSIDSLIKQINLDIAEAKQVLKGSTNG